MKYNENKIIKEIQDYVESTYGQHYSKIGRASCRERV